jgi:hypothetical protein
MGLLKPHTLPCGARTSARGTSAPATRNRGYSTPSTKVEKIGTKQGWSTPAPDENFMFGYPQEIQDFMEAIFSCREPKSGLLAASDSVGVLYAAYLSADRKGAEVEVPLDPALGS